MGRLRAKRGRGVEQLEDVVGSIRGRLRKLGS